VKTWHVLRYLVGQGHQVILASFTRPEEESFVPFLREMCADVYTIPIRRSRFADVGYWLRSHVSGRPFLIERDDLAEMRRVVQEVLASVPVDCIHADQLTMAQFALPFLTPKKQSIAGITSETATKPTLVFDAHNAVWTIVGRMTHNVPWYLRPVLKLEARRVKKYEGQIVASFDHTLAVTDIDRRYLLEARDTYLNGKSHSGGETTVKGSGDRITTIPIAVDTEGLQPVSRKPGSKNIFTMGTLHYPPNADGIRWFVREVFPMIKQRIPDVSLTITGRNPPADFLQLPQESDGAIQVTGYAPQLLPLLKQAALMVVPVRAGSGMRVRILEAFAYGMPVVTTTVGLEGIDAQAGKDVVVADSPQDFAKEVTNLIQDEAKQADLAMNGRNLAECCYDWKVILQRMEEIYEPAG
jgi:glycosyltransferase involved in cell wall biosynthesis